MVSKRTRRTGLVLGLLAVLAGAVLLYLTNADLTWTRGPLARVASRALGRRLSISGAYHLRIGRVCRLEADDVVLANDPWAKDATLLSIGHLEVAMETRSLLKGPLHLLHLAAGGVEIHLEKDGRGKVNWQPATRSVGPPRKSTSPLPQVDRLELEALHATYRSPGRARPLELELDTARAAEGRTGQVDLDLLGIVDGRALRLAGHLGPIGHLLGNRPFDQDLSFRLGSVEGQLKGRTASLSTLAGASLDLELHGPDLRQLTGLLGVAETPGGAFHVTATTRPAGDAIDARLNATTALIEARAAGRIVPGSPPTLELQLIASGKNLEAVAALAGVHGLPARAFRLETSFASRGFPITVKGLKIRTGATILAADGTVGRPPAFDGTGLTLRMEAPDGALIGRLAGVKLPAGKLRVSGRVDVEGETIRVTGLDARMGANELRADGSLGRGARRPGASFEIEASGPRLPDFDALAGVPLPPGPFRAAGKVSSVPDGIRLESLAVELGGDRIEASGLVRSTKDRAGTELELAISGRDPTFLASLAGIHGLPAQPFRGGGHLVVGPHSLKLRRIDIRIGGNEATGEIRLARPPSAGPIELELAIRGEDLGEMDPLLGLKGLPRHPYQASGTLEITPKDYGFSRLELRTPTLTASADGRLGRPPAFDGTSLKINASGPQLSELAAVVTLPELPDLPFDITGGLRIGPEAIELRGVRGTLGTSRIELDGAFRPRGFPIHLAFDFKVHGDDPADTTRFLQGLGLGSMPVLPAWSYSAAGHLEHEPAGFRFGRMELTLGAITGSLDGFLGASPGFFGTRLHVEASGGNVSNIEVLLGKHLDVEGLQFHCSLRRLESKTAAGGPQLRIDGKLAASRLQLGTPDEPRKATAPGEPGKPTSTDREKSETRFVFSEKPFRLKLPKVIEGAIDCRFDDLLLGATHLLDARVPLVLEDGGLRLDPVRAALRGGGSLSGSLALAPEDHGLAVRLRLRLDHPMPGLLLGQKPRPNEPHLDFRLALDGSGTSLHDLLSRANGRFHLKLGRGRVPSSILDSLGDSFFLSLFDALNPFRKKEEMTELDCGAAAGVIEDGTITLDPMGIKTAKVTTLARGTIDLASEKLAIDFASKPRRGIGISASTLTNQYIKIGGTLRKPSVQLKPLSAAAKTGLAVVTAGISLLAEGLWNRVTSGEDICSKMATEIDELWTTPRPAAPGDTRRP